MDEPVTLEFLGRKLIENQESMEILTAIVRLS
jgi:hypothetical protein